MSHRESPIPPPHTGHASYPPGEHTEVPANPAPRWRPTGAPSSDRETTALHAYRAPEVMPYQIPAAQPREGAPLQRTRAATVVAPHHLASAQPSGMVSGMPFASAPPPVFHDSRAALGGASAASDAAARVAPIEAMPPLAKAPVAQPRSAVGMHEYLDLVWYDASAPRKVREQHAWSELLRDAPRDGRWVVGDEAERPEEPLRDERSVRRALSRIHPVPFESIDSLLLEAVDEDGVLDRPLVVLSGELAMTFDPVAVLRAVVATTQHFAIADKKLKEAVDAATELLADSPQVGSTLVDSLTHRIRQVFAATPRGVGADYLDGTVDRIVLDARHYLKRNVLGGPQLVGELGSDAGPSLTTYLGADLSNRLPLFRRFKVKLLAEPHPPQDPSDGGQVSLKALAMARVMPRRSRG